MITLMLLAFVACVAAHIRKDGLDAVPANLYAFLLMTSPGWLLLLAHALGW